MTDTYQIDRGSVGNRDAHSVTTAGIGTHGINRRAATGRHLVEHNPGAAKRHGIGRATKQHATGHGEPLPRGGLGGRRQCNNQGSRATA